MKYLKKFICFFIIIILNIMNLGNVMVSAQNDILININVSVYPGSDVDELRFNWITKYEPFETLLEIAPANLNFEENKILIVGENKKTSNFDIDGDNNKSYWYSNKVTADNLLPSTAYNYRVGDGDFWSDIKTIKTGSDKNTSAYVLTDIHIISSEVGLPLQDSIDNWVSTLNLLNDLDKADLILSLGDQMQNTTKSDYLEGFFNHELLNNFTIAPIDGNHDISPVSNNLQHYTNIPNSQPNGCSYGIGDYFFKQGNVLFVMLSITDINFNNTNHEATFEAAINTFPDYDWLVVCMHEAIYGLYMYKADTIGSNDPLTYHNEIYEPFIKAVEKYNADIVLTGHSHGYSRSHFIKDGEMLKTERNENGQYVDPQGTIWVNMSTSSRQTWATGQPNRPGFPYEWLDYYYSAMTGVSAFGVLETTKNELMLTSYYMFDPESEIDKIRIVKTDIEYEEDFTDQNQNNNDNVNDGNYNEDVQNNKNEIKNDNNNTLLIVTLIMGCIALVVVGLSLFLYFKFKKSNNKGES